MCLVISATAFCCTILCY